MQKIGALFLALSLIVAGWFLMGDSSLAGRPSFPAAKFVITRADGVAFTFKGEVARSVQEQSYGLMFVKSIRDDYGMIFPYDPPREASFWMKNTLIPLDMLFIRPDGTIGRILAEARPGDLTPLVSQEPVAAVIEIKGGQARKDGLSIGDKVVSEAILTRS